MAAAAEAPLRRRGSVLGRRGSSWEVGEPQLGYSSSLKERCLEIDFTLAKALLVAAVLGGLTACTGVYIAINCDFLSDLRFGHCRGLPLADRSHCCGGSDNVDATSGRCAALGLATVTSTIDWVPWEEVSAVPFIPYLIVTVALTLVAATVLAAFAPAAKGSGIPDVKAAVSGFAISQSFSGMCLLVKALGLSMVVGAGLSLGKEGPFIHIGVCWVHVLRNSSIRFISALAESVPLHEVICIGAAAGVATAFGAPVGGVLFAVEELGSVRPLSQRALLLAFAGSFSASFVLKSWNLYGSNQLTFFKLATPTNSPSKEWRTWEMFFFVFLGLLGGLIGALFVKLNLTIQKRRRRCLDVGRTWLFPLDVHTWVVERLPSLFVSSYAGDDDRVLGLTSPTVHAAEAVVIAVATASVNYTFTRLLRQPMVEVIHALFESCPDALGRSLGLCDERAAHGFARDAELQVQLVFAAAARFVETSVTFGAMLPAGLFIPSLYIGAAVGRLVGIWVVDLNLHFDKMAPLNPSVFAMVGAVAVLSGFARMTVSLVVIMLELTGELNYAVPFMVAVLCAKLVGDSFTPSIYDGVATLLGYAAFEEHPPGTRFTACVGDVALRCGPLEVLDVSAPVRLEVLKRFAARELKEACEDRGRGRNEDEVPVQVYETSSSSSGGSAERSESFREALDVLVLVAGPLRQVRGLVRSAALAQWLGENRDTDDALCRFIPVEELRLPSGAGSQEQTLGLQDALDAEDIVQSNFRRLLLSAPVLTAVCAFREFPELGYCVCASDDGAVSVLSRQHLDWALYEGCFAGAFHEDFETQGSSSRTLAHRLRSLVRRRRSRPPNGGARAASGSAAAGRPARDAFPPALG